MNSPEFEDILRCAPAPKPPAHLKDRLLSSIALPTSHSPQPQPAPRLSPAGGVPRWLGMAAGFAAILWIAWGTVERHHLTRHNRELTESLRTLQAEAQPASDAERIALLQDENKRMREQTRELHQLRAEVAALRPLVQELEALRQESQKLVEAFAGHSSRPATPAIPAAEQDDERAQSIRCINNLKNISLAARIWANDNAGDDSEHFPPDLLSMSNELATPRILHCPADTGRTAVSDWPQFYPQSASYEYLNPNGSVTEPLVVMARCTVHGHVALSDGRVIGSAAFSSGNHRLISRDGRLELAASTPEQDDPSSPGYYERLMLKRYGIIPGHHNVDDADTNTLPDQEQSSERFW